MIGDRSHSHSHSHWWHGFVARGVGILVGSSMLSGCSVPQKALNGYASIAFFVYLLSVAAAVGIHRLHDRPGFQDWREKARRWSIPVGVLLLVTGIATTLVHAWLRLSDERINSVPWIFLGAVVAGGGQALIQWARQSCPDKQKLLFKLVSLSMAFSLALLFLATGGQGLKG